MSLGHLSTTPSVWASTKQQTSHDSTSGQQLGFFIPYRRGSPAVTICCCCSRWAQLGLKPHLAAYIFLPSLLGLNTNSVFRSEQGGGTFLLLSEVMNFSYLPQGSPCTLLHPAQPLDIPPPQALTSVVTLLISHLHSLIVGSLHTFLCRPLVTQHLDHQTFLTGENPITHSHSETPAQALSRLSPLTCQGYFLH